MRPLLAAILALVLSACAYAPPGGVRFDPALRDELLTLEARDGEVRALPDSDRPEDQPRMARRRQVDAANAARLREIIEAHGWPDRATVGSSGARAAWTIALHADSDPAFQRRCLDLMQQAQARGEASPATVAYLTDRVLVNEGKPQVYGTQFTSEAGEAKPYPISDPANLDSRRVQAGLPPMADYDRMVREAAIKGRQASGR